MDKVKSYWEKLAEAKAQFLKLNSSLNDESGIYVLTRVDENGIKYAYVGQAKHVLTRLAEHLIRYDLHIDKSLKKHGLFGQDNRYGWSVWATKVETSQLDMAEQRYIKKVAYLGYQLRNKTIGGQCVGKAAIDSEKLPRGYYEGKKQGRKDVTTELNKTLKYLEIKAKTENKLSKRMLDKFWQIVSEDKN